MDQNWFYRGNALIHSLSEQETTSHSVAVWRIGQCGVFLKYNGKDEKEPGSYTLPEFNERQEGVANWFKQMGSLDLKAPMEFPEGFYSVRDTMEEISKNEEALEITSKALKLATNFDIKPGIGMWDMLKTMKPEAMTNMISGIQDGFIESLNARLIKIKK